MLWDRPTSPHSSILLGGSARKTLLFNPNFGPPERSADEGRRCSLVAVNSN